MNRHFGCVVGLALVTLLTSTGASGQERAPAPAAGPVLVPLEIQIVVSRFQGEKKISALPFSLAVNANDNEPSSLRMGAQVPVPGQIFGPTDGNTQPKAMVSVSYRDTGTNIDCYAKSVEGDRFKVQLTIEDSSVYTNAQESSIPTRGDMPVFRAFRSSNTMVLRDGQMRQFTAATDRVNGEVVKVDVTLKVVK